MYGEVEVVVTQGTGKRWMCKRRRCRLLMHGAVAGGFHDVCRG